MSDVNPKDVWIQTYTGRRFYPANPQPEQIDLVDIAHSLSNLTRFNGHCKRRFSVAQHCLLVSRLIQEKYQDNDLALWGLLHDASEAYICDIPGPIKKIMTEYCVLEEKIMDVIADRFQLQMPIPREIKECDKISLATELRDLMRQPKEGWTGYGNIEPIPAKIKVEKSKKVRIKFIEQFFKLW